MAFCFKFELFEFCFKFDMRSDVNPGGYDIVSAERVHCARQRKMEGPGGEVFELF